MCTCISSLFIVIIVFAVLITNIVFYFEWKKYNYENNLIISEIEDNINGKLIESINFRKSCNGDEEKLTLGVWDGTSDGCDCGNILFKNICSKDQKENGCTSLFSNEPINYMLFNSSYICAKKSKLKYRELLKTNQVISKEEKCPNDYKSCGILDSFGRKLCMKENESCPINANTINDIFNSKFLHGENNYSNSYLYNNNSDAQLISIIRLSQYKLCINPTEKFWDYHYTLEASDQRCFTEIKGNLYDERYQKISNVEINKLQLYDGNLITKKLKDIDEVTLNNIKNDKIYLFTRNFLGFDINEFENSNYDYHKLISLQISANKCFLAEVIYSFITLASLIAAFALFFVKSLGTESCGLKVNRLSCAFTIIFFCGFSFGPLFYIIIFPTHLSYITKINSTLDIKSGDEFTNELFKLLIKENNKNFIYILVMTIITPILYIIIVIFNCIIMKSGPFSQAKETEAILGQFLSENKNNDDKDDDDQ
jgi:hypothetical protein